MAMHSHRPEAGRAPAAFLMLATAFGVGVVVAKFLDWRSFVAARR